MLKWKIVFIVFKSMHKSNFRDRKGMFTNDVMRWKGRGGGGVGQKVIFHDKGLDFSQTGVLIDQAASWFQSGSCLINQAAAWFYHGQAAAWFWSSSNLTNQAWPDFDQAAAWPIRQPPDFHFFWFSTV